MRQKTTETLQGSMQNLEMKNLSLKIGRNEARELSTTQFNLNSQKNPERNKTNIF